MKIEQFEQLSIFDFVDDPSNKIYKITKPIRLIELFAGIGAQRMGLRDLKANFEPYKISEWCIPAVNTYYAIHDSDTCIKCDFEKEEAIKILLKYGVSMDGVKPLTKKELERKSVDWLNDIISKFRATNNVGSITNIRGSDLEITDTDKYTYLLTYSFPCQDLSVAGKGRGMTKGSGTRSGLLWEVERLIEECGYELPQILLMENVPQVHAKKNMEDFQEWLNFLKSKGYRNFWQDLNAKDYGVAQSRNRCFCVSIHGEYRYEFPKPFELKKRMKDYLEDEVDEKYYLTTEKARKLIDDLIKGGKILTDRQTDRQLIYAQSNQEQCIFQTVSKQDTMRESQTINATTAEFARYSAYMNLNRVDKINPDVANTLCARDYKGFGTGFITMNGVIECKQQK